MRPIDLFATAFLNLWRRKLRAFLTVLGMVIGVSSIVVMVSLGIGIRQATVDSFAGTGSLTNIRVDRFSYVERKNGIGTSKEKELNKRSVTAFQKIPGVAAVMPMVTTEGMICTLRNANEMPTASASMLVANDSPMSSLMSSLSSVGQPSASPALSAS